MQLSESQLRQIMPKLPASSASTYLPFLNRVMQIYRIETPLRASAFLAQLAHESGELRYWEEIWGPTPQQRKYEPPGDLATRLGNTQPGDGYRYRGRGPIQITGRFNYRKYGSLLGVDIESNPDLAASTQIGFSIAGIFWQNNGLNELADIEDFIGITKKINGGLNGLESRLKYYERAKLVLGVQVTRGVRIRSASMTVTTTIMTSRIDPSPNVLPRGFEAIEMTAESAPKKPARKARKAPVKAAARSSKSAPVAKKAPAKAAARSSKSTPAAKKARAGVAKKSPAKKASSKKSTAVSRARKR
ncbi:MAG: hypothetical protein IPM66_06210 [Acidobacteriota bacterium]|nr:MAG: hypothetical protein IPM66_06210 [Acidobacteriota bacterium]